MPTTSTAASPTTLPVELSLSTEPDALERFGVGGVVRRTDLGCSRTEPLLQLGPIPVLARVGKAGRDLYRHRWTDVYDEVWHR